jgi:hypothetical protein
VLVQQGRHSGGRPVAEAPAGPGGDPAALRRPELAAPQRPGAEQRRGRAPAAAAAAPAGRQRRSRAARARPPPHLRLQPLHVPRPQRRPRRQPRLQRRQARQLLLRRRPQRLQQLLKEGLHLAGRVHQRGAPHHHLRVRGPPVERGQALADFRQLPPRVLHCAAARQQRLMVGVLAQPLVRRRQHAVYQRWAHADDNRLPPCCRRRCRRRCYCRSCLRFRFRRCCRPRGACCALVQPLLLLRCRWGCRRALQRLLQPCQVGGIRQLPGHAAGGQLLHHPHQPLLLLLQLHQLLPPGVLRLQAVQLQRLGRAVQQVPAQLQAAPQRPHQLQRRIAAARLGPRLGAGGGLVQEARGQLVQPVRGPAVAQHVAQVLVRALHDLSSCLLPGRVRVVRCQVPRQGAVAPELQVEGVQELGQGGGRRQHGGAQQLVASGPPRPPLLHQLARRLESGAADAGRQTAIVQIDLRIYGDAAAPGTGALPPAAGGLRPSPERAGRPVGAAGSLLHLHANGGVTSKDVLQNNIHPESYQHGATFCRNCACLALTNPATHQPRIPPCQHVFVQQAWYTVQHAASLTRGSMRPTTA